jgi:hypothetical protein
MKATHPVIREWDELIASYERVVPGETEAQKRISEMIQYCLDLPDVEVDVAEPVGTILTPENLFQLVLADGNCNDGVAVDSSRVVELSPVESDANYSYRESEPRVSDPD